MAALVVEGLGLALGAIGGIMGGLGAASRKITISLANGTGSSWTANGTYFESGTSDEGLPPTIGPNSTLGYGARKTAGPVATGCVGVLAYYIADTDETVVLMWSVPYDYNLYSNWWNLDVLSGNVAASWELYNKLYNTDSAIKGNNETVTRTVGKGRTFEGSMGDSGTPVLKVTVK